MPTIHILIKGEVQGVFYRATAKKVAEKFGINGWVKNTHRGDVEIMATADNDNLEKLVAWCKTGPPAAKVETVLVNEIPDAHFSHFNILRN